MIEISTEIIGTLGRDIISGTNEPERLIGDFGLDLLTGNGGADLFVYDHIRDAGDTITDFEIGVDKIDLTTVLNTFGYSGDNPLGDGYVEIDDYEGGSVVLIDSDGNGDLTARPYIFVESILPGDLDNSDNFLPQSPLPPVNQPPTDITLDPDSVEENVPVNTIVGDFNTEDPDIGDTHTYELVSGMGSTDNSVFTIVNGNQLQINESPDFESKPEYSIRVETTDSGGLSYTEVIPVTVINVIEGGLLSISGDLLNDTGRSDTDRITQDPTIEGDTSLTTTLEASLNGVDFVDITDEALNEDGSYTISTEEYELLTDSLVDGDYTVDIRATDSSGEESATIDVSFTLDRTPPPISLELAPESDTGEIGDNITTESVVTLIGNTESGLEVELVETGQVAIADENGDFTFTDVDLPIVGENPFTTVTEDIAGNEGQGEIILTREEIEPEFGAIAGVKWNDLDGDGTKNDAEPGLAGVTVYLDSNDNGVLDGGEPNQITNETGQYEFNDVAVGSYIVREIVPEGFEQTAPNDGFYEVEVVAGTVVKNIDFGNIEEEIPNTPPEITSTPETVFDTETDTIYTYQIEATDPDGDPLTYTLVSGPEITEINEEGLLEFTPEGDLEPNYEFTVEVSDGRGGTDSQTFTVEVIEPEFGTIQGIKWDDLNGNGVRDINEEDGEEIELINNDSQAYYNNAIGDLYPGDPSDPFAIYFPGPNVSTGDPRREFSMAPDLSEVNELGDWLRDPESSITNGFWSDIQEIPNTWTVNDETSIIYEIDGGEAGINDVIGSFGVDNGIYVWVNGEYKFGAMSSGGAPIGEYEVDLGDLSPGKNYIQILREDHGGATGFNIQITGNEVSQYVEPGLAGVTVYLDTNNNGVLDEGEPTQITAEDDPTTPDIDETGQYEFNDVRVGSYIVREIVPEGFEQTAPNDGFYEVEVVVDEVVENIDFGNQLEPIIYTFTDEEDWEQGTLTNVNYETNSGQLQLDNNLTTIFDHIWIALSGRGSVVKIDTTYNDLDDGVADNLNYEAVLGEYQTHPDGRGANPSRTSVDINGDVWLGNRGEVTDGIGSVVKVSANPTGDDTSTGVWNTPTGDPNTFDRRSWTNEGGVDDDGGTETASDPAILQYVRVPDSSLVRHVSIDENNNVWVGGYPGGPVSFNLLDGDTGDILDSFDAGENFGAGGYGGLVDGNGILWSASLGQDRLLRYDPATGEGKTIGVPDSYGLAIDTNGFIWNSTFRNGSVYKIDPEGNVVGVFSSGGSGSRGVAVTSTDNNVWIANTDSNSVTRLDNDGNLLASIPVGSEPTGVAVDSSGKVWVTNRDSDNVMRIDPVTNTVDLTIYLGDDAYPYNYSDMTGGILSGVTIPTGKWTVVQDSEQMDQEWNTITWNTEPEGNIPEGADITLKARTANNTDDLVTTEWQTFNNGDDLGLFGQYIQLEITLTKGGDIESISPILSDVNIEAKAMS